jgi:hypothetical protein
VLVRLFRLAWLWSAYWRLYPLWDSLRQVIPEIQLPPEPGLRWNIRYRLHRRVIEIRDAELVLRPYAAAEVAGQAAATARSSGLHPDQAAAVVEAAIIVSSIQSRLRGSVCRHDDIPPGHVGAAPGNDIRAEVVRLILVCRAIRRSRIVRCIAGRYPGRITLLGRMAERAAKLLDCVLAGRRAAQDEGGEGFRFPLLRRSVGSASEDQLNKRLVHIRRQEADKPAPGRRVLVAEQHVRQFMQDDVGSVKGRRAGLVVDVVGVRGANPQAGRDPNPGTERAQPDRAVPFTFQPGHELTQVERDRHLQVPDHRGMPPFRIRAKHCLPQHAQRIARCVIRAVLPGGRDGEAIICNHVPRRRGVQPASSCSLRCRGALSRAVASTRSAMACRA